MPKLHSNKHSICHPNQEYYENHDDGKTEDVDVVSTNNQKRVIFVGYWMSNDAIPGLVTKWKQANITHVILTFITQGDVMKPLSDAFSMTQAFKGLTVENQQLLKNNFVLGISYGGSGAMPNPYSSTFAPGAYYHNNPQLLAQDFVRLAGNIDAYYDLDIEYINDKFDECATFIGEICKELRALKPNCQISHAPQPPFFTAQFGNVYNKIYQNYHQYFNFFNIQYYNNGPSDNFQQIFITSYYPGTAVLELIASGIDASYIIVGKPVDANQGSAGGYIPLVPNLENIISQAFSDARLKAWSDNAGVMIWYYDTQASDSINNNNVLAYMNYVSNLQS